MSKQLVFFGVIIILYVLCRYIIILYVNLSHPHLAKTSPVGNAFTLAACWCLGPSSGCHVRQSRGFFRNSRTNGFPLENSIYWQCLEHFGIPTLNYLRSPRKISWSCSVLSFIDHDRYHPMPAVAGPWRPALELLQSLPEETCWTMWVCFCFMWGSNMACWVLPHR